jgi:hypothetical protein
VFPIRTTGRWRAEKVVLVTGESAYQTIRSYWGWHNILLNYSMQGWELVSVVGESFPGFRVYHYRLFLKRPIEEGA